MIYPQISFDVFHNDGIDYGVVKDGPLTYRGPSVNQNQNYWVCIGTAMTFGRYVEAPYPTLLNKSMPTFNFGFGHLDSRALSKYRPYRTIIQNASLVIIQYSPANNYLEGLPCIFDLATKYKMIVFDEIQQGNCPYADIIKIPGEAINKFYPSQKSHTKAAEIILSTLNN